MRISDWSSDVCSSDLGTAPSSPAAPLDAATAPCQDAAALPLRVPPMIETALVALTTFFATIGPLDVAALFAALTPHNTPRARRALALKGTLIATGDRKGVGEGQRVFVRVALGVGGTDKKK